MKNTRLNSYRGMALWSYIILIALVAVCTVGVLLVYQNIITRKAEATQHVFKVVEISDSQMDPKEWGKNYPRQYDSYLRTADLSTTRHGASDSFQILDADPRWRTIFSGYPFGVDYREARGHAYMLADQDKTERVKQFKQPGACLHCHSAIQGAYIEAGLKAGAPAGPEHREEQLMKGFEAICPMPIAEARKLVDHPVTCVDCHEADSMNLRVNRPGFLNGIRALADSSDPVAHLPSIERWRKDGRKGKYDANTMASRQEMRSMVCAQCHVEYYFKGAGKLVTFPWQNGLKVEQIETYYNDVKHVDFKHKESGAPVLKAQHPEFELWSQGIHARSGVSCADCHMPYVREGAIKVSSHHVRSPLKSIAQSCQTCHRVSEEEIKSRVDTIQDRHEALLIRAEDSVVALINAIKASAASGMTDEQLAPAREFQRKAQWRLDFIAAENSMGFHAPQESARILGEAIDYAGQGQVAVLKLAKTN